MKDPKELFESLELIRSLLEISDEGFFAFDCDCRYRLWSKGMERMVGLPAEEVLGQHAFTLFPFLKAMGTDKYLLDALDGKASVARDRAFDIPDTGRKGFYDAHYAPLKSQGQVIGGIALIRDTTLRKEAERKVVEMETRFQRMADSSPVLLWMSGTDSLCNFFNRSWLEFTGRRLEQELGVGWAEGVHPEDLQDCLDCYVEAFRKQEPFEMEYRLRRHDGQYRWVLDRGVPRFENGFAGYIGSCVDITERRMIEEELKKSIRERDEFLSIASHELKSPLTSLQLQVQMFRHSVTGEPQAEVLERMKKVSDVAERQIKKLTELVRDLLDLSRMQMGIMDLRRQLLNLSETVGNVMAGLSEQCRAAACPIELRCHDRSVVGLWDPARMEQVITNLIGNALKYGSGHPVRVTLSQTEESAFFSVRDSGIGIEKEKIPMIFNRFTRAVSDEHFGGLGLGLFIAHEIVKAHGGSIQVQSELGRGAEFIVELPKDLERNEHRSGTQSLV